MSVPSEQPPTDPQDLLHYAPRRLGERPEPRLAAVNETPLERQAAPDAAGAIKPVAAASGRREITVGAVAVPAPVGQRRRRPGLHA